MPLYQITSILRATAPQSEVHDLMRRLTRIVIDRNGVLASINNWGLQQLAYRMRAHQEYHRQGRYVQFKIVVSPDTLKEVERNMKLDTTVLRFMIIKERNTSIASFANLDPEQLAEAAETLSRQLQQTTAEPERNFPDFADASMDTSERGAGGTGGRGPAAHT
jgi:small subunit ribosomal protein S6